MHLIQLTQSKAIQSFRSPKYSPRLSTFEAKVTDLKYIPVLASHKLSKNQRKQLEIEFDMHHTLWREFDMHYTHFGISHLIAIHRLFHASSIGLQPPFGQLLMTVECEAPSLRFSKGTVPRQPNWLASTPYSYFCRTDHPCHVKQRRSNKDLIADLDAPCRMDAEAANMTGDDNPGIPTQVQREGSDA